VTDYLTTTEIVRAARRKLHPDVWDFISGGSETETTIRRNREAIEALALRARVLRDVRKIDTSTTLLGSRLRIPYILAPVGGLQQIDPSGAAGQVHGACAFGTLPVVSSVAQPSPEACAAAAPGDKWFQLYTRGDLAWIGEILARVRDAGYRVLVITVDVALYGNRERQKLTRFSPSARLDTAGEEYQAALDWDQLERIRELAGLPLVVKGIQAAEDAVIALERGFDGLWVSNHGGRQLDHALGSLDVLPEVVEVTRGRVPVIVDGGFMRGTDVLKAIALGADAVATGRMHAWALGAGGVPALERMLELVEYEIRTSMALLGVTAPSQLDPSFVRRVDAANGRGAFPLFHRVREGDAPPA